MIIDMFRSKYRAARENSQERRDVAREIFDTLINSGYRFFRKNKEDEKYYQMESIKEIKDKVGHSLRDELSKLSSAAAKKADNKGNKDKPTCAMQKLLRGQLSIVGYAEHLADIEEDDISGSPESNTSVKDPENYGDMMQQKKESQADLFYKAMPSAPSLLNGIHDPMKYQALEVNIPKERSSDELEPCVRFLDDLVMTTITNNTLPVPGDWKFYPRQELGNLVNLGTDHEGWQLHLRPLLHDADPLTFDVPSPKDENDKIKTSATSC
eukprot:CAMPEP_0178899664 /NCGR_PEP_ID=MMETSP0786-20121207/3032_1 /TAXON_ID=186022 /ORGANISM="Thalassionema frauenfeldii, Strain CCMP 1798" /LENGTH=267 /DNA_ID=CAMNT_0020570559 /DNA_START=148 /DNA_END=951 /DNA_ORIENTATION=-